MKHYTEVINLFSQMITKQEQHKHTHTHTRPHSPEYLKHTTDKPKTECEHMSITHTISCYIFFRVTAY